MGSIQVRKENKRLILDFYHQGIRCREQTALEDTPANRKKVQKLLDRIEGEISLGTFDYQRYFPSSRNAARFRQSPMASAVNAVLSAGAAASASGASTSRHSSTGSRPSASVRRAPMRSARSAPMRCSSAGRLTCARNLTGSNNQPGGGSRQASNQIGRAHV